MDFEKAFRELQSLTGSISTMDLFNQAYETLLISVNREAKPKSERLTRLSYLLRRQFLYLLAQWHEVKAIDKMGGQPEETTTVRRGMN